MRPNRSKLEKSITSKEFLIYWWELDPYEDGWYGKKRNPCPNRRGNFRNKNERKTWKNYRKHQWKNLT
jgi:hypothetical protein